jgi:hypothetical protein
MELKKTSDGYYIGGIKMDGTLYVIEAQAKRSLLWGKFSKEGGNWPFFVHWTGNETVSFHTGNHVEKNIVDGKRKSIRIAAEKKAKQEK